MTPEGDSFLSSLSVVSLTPDFSSPGFNCGEPDLTQYLCDGTAAADQVAVYSRCYLIYSGAGEFVGYFAVLADSIRLQNKERPSGVNYRSAPALKLGRMGVDNQFKRRGVGAWILDFVVGLARSLSEDIGVRYVTLDALKRDSLVGWYQRYGFVPNKDEQKVRFKLLQLRRPNDDLATVSMRFDILLQEELAEQES